VREQRQSAGDDVVVYRCDGTLAPSLKANVPVLDDSPTSSPRAAEELEELQEAQAAWMSARARRELGELQAQSRLQEDLEDCRAVEMERQLELDLDYVHHKTPARVAGG
jgi:hypothetical protein